jgi:hypothetical protein
VDARRALGGGRCENQPSDRCGPDQLISRATKLPIAEEFDLVELQRVEKRPRRR